MFWLGLVHLEEFAQNLPNIQLAIKVNKQSQYLKTYSLSKWGTGVTVKGNRLAAIGNDSEFNEEVEQLMEMKEIRNSKNLLLII